MLNGAGAPTDSAGADGDFYIDTSGHVLYGPKASGHWPSPGVSLGASADLSNYYTKSEADVRYKADCRSGFTYYGGLCWQVGDNGGHTFASGAQYCAALGGWIPRYADMVAVAASGIALTGGLFLDWASDVTADNEAIYINTSVVGPNMDGVRAQSTSSYVRCVVPPLNALGVS